MKKTYCCFNSKLARAIHEQGRIQLKTDLGDWGEPESPNCRGFTPEEFQMLDFSRIDLGEFIEEISPKDQGEIEDDLRNKLEDFYDTTL